ncbi:MAG: XrtA system polysaccharide deacetylase [Burkholderiaceae bacterium]|jgi:polysaccharide deacetylase family protein (PEP-CTERM system associated)
MTSAPPGAADAPSRTAIVNALTVDVEDYFQVSAMAPYIARSAWDTIECRVENNVDRMLARFDKHGAHATFFTLGWVAERYPALIRRIVAGGHELASHGYGHQRASDLSREEFEGDITRAKGLLEDIGGVAVRGYRAPSFSIDKRNLWAFDSLRDAGYVYSSSVYPVHHDHYGMPDAPRFPYSSTPGLTEIPISTVRAGNRNIPIGGGGYFRLLPYVASRYAIARFNRQEGRPAIFYIHPWEIDPQQPRVAGVDAKSRFRHYVSLHRTEGRLERLLTDFRWDRVDRVFDVEARPAALAA